MRISLLALSLLISLSCESAAEWAPKKSALTTRWAKDVSPEKVHPEYPRPQMVRKNWQNLNGLWQYAIRPRDEEKPTTFDGEILVPFPVESALSGVMKRVGEENRLWYRREFSLSEAPEKSRWLLHFGAVDWHTTVWLNGTKLGEHKGGYDPFTLDATDALKADGPQELVVSVWDPTDASWQPRGKQVNKPRGIWYTPVTGIWQTVWLEPVPETYITDVQFEPNIETGEVRVKIGLGGKPLNQEGKTAGQRNMTITVSGARNGDKEEPLKFPVTALADHKGEATFKLKEMWLWSPENPWLYDVKVSVNGDVVDTYFGARSISLGKDKDGITRILLNGKALFQYGPLDQGWWPDGLYTAPTDEALLYDIEVTKKLGFNMIRKHVKTEPARWYYHCDRLGMLVWQDMPNGDRHIRGEQPDIKRVPESTKQFETEWKAIMDALRVYPSIVMWVPFNEGWGQFDTARIVELTRKHDPTRLVDNASGWTDRNVGDVIDMHRYPGPASPDPEKDRAAVLGEFGGLGLPIEGHTWLDKGNWGYKSYTTKQALTDGYLGLMTQLRPLIQKPGLSAAVYTQTTDVEIEVNGFMTYDRAVIKMPIEPIAEANRKLYLPPPIVKVIVPTSQKMAQSWKSTVTKPDDAWFKPDFDDSAWNAGKGGFGTKETPGAVVRQEWNSSDIWLRRSFELPEGAELQDPHLRMHHDEDATVYINGVLAGKATGYRTDYGLFPISREARNSIKPGLNVIAVHCHQTRGGQYIDVGLVDLAPSSTTSDR